MSYTRWLMQLTTIVVSTIAILFSMGKNAYSNGATAGHASTGLFFVEEENVSIENEILKIDNQFTEVLYIYKNHSDKDITSTIAFPIALPYSETFYDMPYDDFELWVAGEKKDYDVEHRVLLYEYKKEQTDYTKLFKQLGLPLLYKSKEELMYHLAGLSREELLLLEKNGLISHSTVVPGYISLHWQVATKYFWTQTFPANDTVRVRIKYKSNPGYMDVEEGTEGRPAAIVNYILTTANYWHGPIKNFTLIASSNNLGKNVTMGVGGIDKKYLVNEEDGTAIYRIENFTPEKNLSIYYEFDPD